jgi:hypothetical protein
VAQAEVVDKSGDDEDCEERDGGAEEPFLHGGSLQNYQRNVRVNGASVMADTFFGACICWRDYVFLGEL